jgi:hypothetical protein
MGKATKMLKSCILNYTERQKIPNKEPRPDTPCKKAKKNFSPIQRVFHKKCESALAGFCGSTTNFALFGELPLKRNKSGK